MAALLAFTFQNWGFYLYKKVALLHPVNIVRGNSARFPAFTVYLSPYTDSIESYEIKLLCMTRELQVYLFDDAEDNVRF
jgi:hypothetical protein